MTPEERAERRDEHKSRLMEQSLGQEHDMVLHAIIPYAVGGALDLYYYPNGRPGVGIATKELTELPNEGASNRVFRSYELVMFTRRPLDMDAVQKPATPFGRTHARMSRLLNMIARYSADASLNPNETCEFPADFPDVGGACLIFDGFACHTDDVVDRFGLLLLLEVFRSEMEYARSHGGGALLAKLKEAGHYPYSDMDRRPVV
jgi:hypothetical protein